MRFACSRLRVGWAIVSKKAQDRIGSAGTFARYISCQSLNTPKGGVWEIIHSMLSYDAGFQTCPPTIPAAPQGGKRATGGRTNIADPKTHEVHSLILAYLHYRLAGHEEYLHRLRTTEVTEHEIGTYIDGSIRGRERMIGAIKLLIAQCTLGTVAALIETSAQLSKEQAHDRTRESGISGSSSPVPGG